MNLWHRIQAWRRALFQQRQLDVEMDEEMRAHLELRTQANVEAGMTVPEARCAALRQFGWTESVKETCREQRGMAWLENLARDIRFGTRQLRKNPGFTAVAVLTLALGIGANTAIFSVIYGVLLKPLPYRHPEQLVSLWERSLERGIEEERVSGPNYLAWREQNRTLTELAVSPAWEGSERFNLVTRDAVVKIRGSYASASLFRTLGTKPLLGRGFVNEEDRKDGDRVAVLGYGLWRRQFGDDTNVVGQTLTVDSYGRRDYTIVGVMPEGFGTPGQCELWLPLGWMGVSLTERRSAHWHTVIARLKPGVTLAQTRADLNAIQARLKQAYPGETIGSEVAVAPLVQQAVGRNMRTALLVLWGVVAGVLLIACANVANLMLARSVTREREIAVRLSLGAARWRVMRQLIIESLVLAMIGGGLGVLLAGVGLPWFVAANPGNLPRLNEVALDFTALAFTAGVSLLTGVLFGLAPAWQCGRLPLNEVLKQGARGFSGGASAGRTRDLLVVTQVAVSMALLAGAAVMLQSFARMVRAERGYQPGHLLTATLDFSVSGFSTWVRPTATRPQVALKALIERIRAIPGVQAVGAGSRLLRSENRPPNERIAIFGQPTLKPEEQRRAEFIGISPGWLRALGAQLLAGRDFTEADTLEAAGVVLINETLARRYFPQVNPIGQFIKMGDDPAPLSATNSVGLPVWSTVVGVITDVKSLHPRPEAVPEVCVPYWQWPMQNPALLVRTAADPALLAEAIRRETKAVIPNLPTPLIRTMDSLLAETLAPPRLEAGLLTLFAGLALLLASIGLYGMLTCTVSQRTREIGIRIALGAQPKKVLALVIGKGMKAALVGVGAGVAAAFALTRLMASMLYEVKPADPVTFGAVASLLLGVALLACWLPAKRAARVDPIVALRTE